MIRKNLQIALLFGSCVALSGCASIFGEKFAAKFRTKPVEFAMPAPEIKGGVEVPGKAATFTDIGRQQLADGQTGAALDSFRLAYAVGEPSAPAFNGIAVAYVRLGSFEQAQRFFGMAIEAAPEEESYRSNMARLMSSPLLAQRKDGDRGAAIAAASVPKGPAAAVPALAEAGKLTRISRNEFRIVTVPQGKEAAKAPVTRTAAARLPKVVIAPSRTEEGDAALRAFAKKLKPQPAQ